MITPEEAIKYAEKLDEFCMGHMNCLTCPFDVPRKDGAINCGVFHLKRAGRIRKEKYEDK